MSKTKKLLFEIEIGQLRLVRAIQQDNPQLLTQASVQLSNLKDQLINELTEGINVEREAVYYLVFSETHLDGKVMTQIEYRELVRTMNHLDRETHLAVEVPGPMKDATEQEIFLERERLAKKSQKRSA
jgi:hypothetical protein